MRVVVKLGGSVMETATIILSHLVAHMQDIKDTSILIIPGGGMFANAIRSASRQYSIGDDAAHWMAILAMEQYAYYLIEKTGIRTVDSIENIPAGVSIMLPYQLLKKEDELPHSWDVTSDTIAAWVANRIDARFVKVTDVDGVFQESRLVTDISAEELEKMGTTCADRYFPGFLRSKSMDCVVVNGNFPERVADAIRGKDTIGTYIRGNV